MKTQTSKTNSLKIFVIILLLGLFVFPETTFAQRRYSGHRNHYVYYPEHNFYYNTTNHMYYYANNGRWSISASIPMPFININLGRAVQVNLDYYGAYPYYYNTHHCTEYRVVKVHKPRKVIYVHDNYHNHHYRRHHDDDDRRYYHKHDRGYKHNKDKRKHKRHDRDDD